MTVVIVLAIAKLHFQMEFLQEVDVLHSNSDRNFLASVQVLTDPHYWKEIAAAKDC